MCLLSFPKLQIDIKVKINNVTMLEAKPWGALAEYEMVHFTQCFQQWNNHGACCMKSQGDHFDGDKTDQKLRIVLKENYIQSGNYVITPCLLHVLLCHIKLFRGRLQTDYKLVILDFLGLSDVKYTYELYSACLGKSTLP